MIIRKATQKDLKSLNELHIAFAKHSRRKFCKTLVNPELVRNKYLEYYKKKIKQKNCVFFVAEEKGKITGYILGEIEGTGHHHIYKKRGYIHDLFVVERQREKGIGEKLTERLIEWFRSKRIKWIRVDSYINNKVGIKFWNKMGFRDYVLKMTKVIR